MEGRGGVADYRVGTDELTYHAAAGPARAAPGAGPALPEHPADRSRVVIPDIGGAFGQKAGLSREDLVVCAAAKMLGRPVKWVEDRPREPGLRGPGAPTETIEINAAVKNDGTILAARREDAARTRAPIPSQPRHRSFGWIVRTMIGSAYRITTCAGRSTSTRLTRPSYNAYRGPWAAETLAREILIDRIAHELELDPVDVRRRNLLPRSTSSPGI